MAAEIKTLQDVESLVALNKQIESLKNENIHTLTICSSNLVLPEAGCSGIFEEEFPALESLHMNNNQIESFTSSNFWGLKNLRHLELRNNGIRHVEEGAFSVLKGLFNLDLSGNRIETLGDGLFDGLSNVGVLNLKGNGIQQLGKEVFRGMHGLFSLDLSGNKIEELGGDFEDLANLGHLILKNNSINRIDSSAFSGMKNLYHLDLSYNKLTKLPAGLFAGLSIKGHCLNLSNNLIAEIEPGALRDLRVPSGVLDLSYNSIVTLALDTFVNVTVEKLFLSDNQIEVIEVGAFHRCDCDTLDLHKNQICDLSCEALEGLDVEKELCLSNNKIKSCAGVFQNFKKLQSLNLGKNDISELPDDGFQGLKSIILIFLSSNNISALNKDSFNGLDSLAVLYLQENQIESIHPECFMPTKSLISLIMHSNKLAELEAGIFANTPNLHDLDLMNNAFTVLPSNSVYQGLKKLRILNFSYNKLETISSNSFAPDGDAKHLEAIFLNDNQVSVIEAGAFEGMDYVKYLVLGSNRIGSLEEGSFRGIGSIHRLELDKNLLESPEMLQRLPPCKLVMLAGNPMGSELSLDGLELGQLEVISFEDRSYQRVEDHWNLNESPIEDMEETRNWEEMEQLEEE